MTLAKGQTDGASPAANPPKQLFLQRNGYVEQGPEFSNYFIKNEKV